MAAAGSSPEPLVLLGVTGCIAAYKACEVLRQLQKAGLRVKVVMTPTGAEFVSAHTFMALSGAEVAVAPMADPSRPIQHVSLAAEADVFVIAPTTANTINKLAAGVADNLLTTTALATEAPLIIAPAMNVHMWRKRTTQGALDQLRQRGVEVVEPESGYLACGEEGEGRLAEPGQIVAAVLRVLARHNDWRGRRLLITAGATREYIDPVRFISSPASGRTGYLLAEEAARRGAEVFLVSGPTDLPSPFGVTTVRVTSADEMYAACLGLFAKKDFDAAVLTAAVADYRPAVRAEQKLKKAQGLASGETEAARLDLVLNPDILCAISAQKGRCYVVGFAAESENVIENGRAKLLAKGADLIVANDISQDGCGFASWQNRWHLVSVERDEDTGMADKRNLAGLLLDRIAGHLH